MIVGIGAEAILEKEGNELVKRRIVKGYRLKEIDIPLRKERTVREGRLLSEAARWKIRVPQVIDVNDKTMEIRMEFINGPVVKNALDIISRKERDILCQEIGKMTALLHLSGIVHGDLTTSNMILKDGKIDQLYFIDFGLANSSKKIEDFAVDIHLIKEALISKHNPIWEECFGEVLEGYSKNMDSEMNRKVLERLKTVEKRGRYNT